MTNRRIVVCAMLALSCGCARKVVLGPEAANARNDTAWVIRRAPGAAAASAAAAPAPAAAPPPAAAAAPGANAAAGTAEPASSTKSAPSAPR